MTSNFQPIDATGEDTKFNFIVSNSEETWDKVCNFTHLVQHLAQGLPGVIDYESGEQNKEGAVLRYLFGEPGDEQKTIYLETYIFSEVNHSDKRMTVRKKIGDQKSDGDTFDIVITISEIAAEKSQYLLTFNYKWDTKKSARDAVKSMVGGNIPVFGTLMKPIVGVISRKALKTFLQEHYDRLKGFLAGKGLPASRPETRTVAEVIFEV